MLFATKRRLAQVIEQSGLDESQLAKVYSRAELYLENTFFGFRLEYGCCLVLFPELVLLIPLIPFLIVLRPFRRNALIIERIEEYYE